MSSRIDFLAKHYPCLWYFVMKERGVGSHITDNQMKSYKQYENDHGNFTLYVHGYFLPQLEQWRESGLLWPNQVSQLMIYGEKFKYVGETDCSGVPTGKGIATF